MKKLILILLAISCFHITSAQFTLKSAAKEFENMNYAKAAFQLESVIKTHGESKELLQMLADSYYNNSKFDVAEPWFKKLIELYETELDSKYFFKYANILKAANKPKEAETWIKKFSEENPNDSRVQAYQKHKVELDEILKKPPQFEISKSAYSTSQSDFAATLFNGQIVFTSAKNGMSKELYQRTNQPYLDLFKAEIDDTGKPKFGIQKFSTELNTTTHDGVATFTKDGKTMYFTRTNTIKEQFLKNEIIINKLKLYKAELVKDEWKKIQELPFNNDKYSVGHPALNADGTKLYFISDMPGGYGLTDLYVVDIHSDGSFGVPFNLGLPINSEGREMFPTIIGNNLYYSSDGHWGLGALDIFKIDLNQPTMGPVNMGIPLNSTFDDFYFVYDDVKKIGFVSSNRPGGEGDDDIYLLKSKIYEQFVFGKVKELISENLLPGSEVALFDEEGTELNRTKVKEDALYKFKIDPYKPYKLTGTKKDYTTDIKDVLTTEGVNQEVDLNIKKEEFVFVRGKCIVKIDPIYFDFDKYNIRPDAAIELDKVVEIMKKYPELIIEGGSHTDSRGRFKYNETLSSRRAHSTVDYIISKGISASRVSAKGYGETVLVNGCADGVSCTEAEHQLNRRTEFTVVNIDEVRNKYPDICGTEAVSINEMITKRKRILEKRKGEAFDTNFNWVEDKLYIKTKTPIEFELNAVKFSDVCIYELDRIIELMYIHSFMQIEIGVHTDSRGNDQENLRITDSRAQLIAEYFRTRGISTYRISAKGYGETKLLNNCFNGVNCTEVEHHKNRRVEFRVINPDAIK